MRTTISILALIFILFSCTEEEIDKSDPDLVGSWKLVEILQDPGDGSGVFMPVESDKIVVFSLEGTFTSNGDLCMASSDSNTPSSGVYDKDSRVISVNDCEDFGFSNSYRIEEGELIISGFSCIEGCSEKYVRN